MGKKTETNLVTFLLCDHRYEDACLNCKNTLRINSHVWVFVDENRHFISEFFCSKKCSLHYKKRLTPFDTLPNDSI